VRPPRILIVDDEKYVRGFLREVIAGWGHQVDVAADGREGLRMLVERSYDLVLTDLHMPGLSGLDLIETIRLRGSSVRVIMLTATTEDAVGHSDRLDFELVPKPVHLSGLETMVRRALGEAVAPPSSFSLP
jgi:two-component system, NtrC family, nitrogen regulation response regulator NtrX